jgi:large conductance mechanosensitive channel
MLDEFKKFLLRGNVVDLAVAVAVGASFTAVVNALVKDLITPLIAAVGAKPNFEGLSFTLHHSTFMYGDFLNVLISFAIMAAVVFFFVVQPVNQLVRMARRGKQDAAAKDPQLVVLEEIRDALKTKGGKKS